MSLSPTPDIICPVAENLHVFSAGCQSLKLEENVLRAEQIHQIGDNVSEARLSKHSSKYASSLLHKPFDRFTLGLQSLVELVNVLIEGFIACEVPLGLVQEDTNGTLTRSNLSQKYCSSHPEDGLMHEFTQPSDPTETSILPEITQRSSGENQAFAPSDEPDGKNSNNKPLRPAYAYKMFLRRHERPYKCHYDGCAREGRGFMNPLNLNHHLREDHKAPFSALHNYQCLVPSCSEPDMTWSLVDDYEQHVIRMHPGTNVGKILRMAE